MEYSSLESFSKRGFGEYNFSIFELFSFFKNLQSKLLFLFVLSWFNMFFIHNRRREIFWLIRRINMYNLLPPKQLNSYFVLIIIGKFPLLSRKFDNIGCALHHNFLLCIISAGLVPQHHHVANLRFPTLAPF